MIQIRDVLQVKFGKIDQAVDLFTQASERIVLGQHFEVLTDITGPMYSLVHEFVVADLAELQQLQTQQQAQPDFAPWFRQYQQFVEGGRREYYAVEGGLATWSQPGAVIVREAYRSYKWQMQATVSLLQRYGGLLEFFGVGSKPRVLTDLSGPLFQAVIEIETGSLSHWETQRRELYRQAEFQVWFNQMMTSVEAGAHELYRVEYANR